MTTISAADAEYLLATHTPVQKVTVVIELEPLAPDDDPQTIEIEAAAGTATSEIGIKLDHPSQEQVSMIVPGMRFLDTQPHLQPCLRLEVLPHNAPDCLVMRVR
jgi:hypothetical protein